jgi:hydrogenase maturation protease
MGRISHKAEDKIAIITVGNELMGDDGVGPVVFNELEKGRLPKSADLREGGTGGLALLHILAKYRRVVIVDCCDFGAGPGEFRVFSQEDLKKGHDTNIVSLHDLDLQAVLDLARTLDSCPETIRIIGVQPASVKPGMGISENVKKAVPDIVKATRKTCEELCIE